MQSVRWFLIWLATHLAVSGCKPKTFTIAFGSCNHQDKPQVLWNDIVAEKPDLWIWLGDNIYADTYDVTEMRAKYNKQKSHPGYQKLVAACPVIGTWDDHDYGVNDGGKEYPVKQQSKALLLDFLTTPKQDPVYSHEGVYTSHTYGTPPYQVKIILLDTRYFRDSLKTSNVPGRRYEPTANGDILGEEQWQWLERELSNSQAMLHIIGSSIQFVPTGHGWEKWYNFTSAHIRMIDLLSRVKTGNVFFISGDRHIAELSAMEVPGWHHPLYDLTSSGLTHTWESGWEENQYRVGDLIKQLNYGLIQISWAAGHPVVTLQVKGRDRKVYLEKVVDYTVF